MRAMVEDIAHLEPGSGPTALVELRGVSRHFGEREATIHAVRDVGLTVWPAERIALVGPSGSGKTTLLGLIGLLDTPDAGTITLSGVPMNGLSEDDRADARRTTIGFIFQLFHLIPGLSALDNVTVPLAPFRSRREIEERGRALLAELGLENRTHHLPRQLSGGEQQRVAIARALINDPRLILADEPTGNLDTATGDRVIALLDELHRTRGFALVVATHDLGLATSMDRTIRMQDGAIID